MDIKRVLIKKQKIDGKFIFSFKYLKNNISCTDEDLIRIKKLHIPPNWKDVCISNNSVSHLQVIGNDGTKCQYIYHPMWVMLTNQNKYKSIFSYYKLQISY